MSDMGKVLGQVDSTLAADDILYTVPSLSQMTSSTLMICNRTAVSASFRVRVIVGGLAVTGTNDKQYLFYDAPIGANTTVSVTIGMTLSETDEVYTYASTTGFSFNLFGMETTV